jgi:hypothetical protein
VRTSGRRVVTGLLGALLAVSPAWAEHKSAPPAFGATEIYDEQGQRLDVPGSDTSLDLNLKLGRDGFRLGSRLFGRDGYLGGAFLNGLLRPDGFRLDGRVEHDGKSDDFKLDADLDEWWRRLLRWRGGALEL